MYNNNPFTDLKDAYCPNVISVSVRICGTMCSNNVTNNVSETQNTVYKLYLCTVYTFSAAGSLTVTTNGLPQTACEVSACIIILCRCILLV